MGRLGKPTAPFARGEKLVFSGRARSPQNLTLYAFLEENSAPFQKQASVRLSLNAEWQRFEARGILARDFAPQTLSAGFQLAFGTGTIELADLRVEREALDWVQIEARTPLLATDFAPQIPKNWSLSANFPLESKVVEIAPPSPGISRALRIEANSPQTANLWDARLASRPNEAGIVAGDLFLVQFWARSDSPFKPRISPVVQRGGAPFEKILQEIAPLSPTWKRFTFYASAKTDFAPQSTVFELQWGGLRGALEIADLRVVNLGAVPQNAARARFGAPTIDFFGGATWDDNSWRIAAQGRIEKHRKAPLQIRVLDERGRAVRGAQVKITQTRHAFRFGTAVNKTLLETGENGDRYRHFVRQNFNTATLENDMKWRLSDGNPEVQNRAVQSVKWLRDHKIEVRGHTMVWGAWRFLPPRIEKMSADEARRELEKWVRESGARHRGTLYAWDVVNEAARNTDLFEKIGWDAFPQAFRWAREADPSAKLAYNDYDISNEGPDGGKLRATVEERIQKLVDANAPLDVLGDQAHLFTPLTPIPRVIEIWESWRKRWGLPLEITEFDAAIEDDELHAKYFADFLTAAFAQPNVESFIVWGFWENAHWRGADAALVRADWTKRPAQLAYENLVFEKWRTLENQTTNRRGETQTRGFLGDYEIAVSHEGKTTVQTAKLEKNGASVEVRLGS